MRTHKLTLACSFSMRKDRSSLTGTSWCVAGSYEEPAVTFNRYLAAWSWPVISAILKTIFAGRGIMQIIQSRFLFGVVKIKGGEHYCAR